MLAHAGNVKVVHKIAVVHEEFGRSSDCVDAAVNIVGLLLNWKDENWKLIAGGWTSTALTELTGKRLAETSTKQAVGYFDSIPQCGRRNLMHMWFIVMDLHTWERWRVESTCLAQ